MTSSHLNPNRFRIHGALLLVAVVIALLGVANIYSATFTTSPRLWLAQLAWLALGFVVSLAALSLDYRLIERIAYPFYLAVCGLLLGVLLYGKRISGARRWLSIGAMQFQPSELMKIAMIFAIAKYFSSEERLMRRFTLRALLKPLHLTRPLVVIALILLKWRKSAWLQNPVSTLAAKIHEAHQGVPLESEPTFVFRITLLTLIAVYAFVGYTMRAMRSQNRGALMSTSPLSERAFYALWLLPIALASALLWGFWDAAWVMSPYQYWINALIARGAPEVVSASGSVYWFRLLLLLGALAYGALCVWFYLRRRTGTLDDWLAPVDLIILPSALIMVQPDLGTALLVAIVAGTLLLMVGMHPVSVLLATLLATVTSYASWFIVLKDYQKQRILTFLDPEADALGTGYHANQSIIAVGSGRLWGKGFRGGTQSQLRFLPEKHTDFAFSVWSEEHGFIGCLALIALYFVLTLILVRIASSARDRFGTLLVSGFAALIFWQAFVNIGMVIGILPIVGVPLPLFSYGGSALLTVMIGLGITLNVAYRRA